jgi:hypothetical protein
MSDKEDTSPSLWNSEVLSVQHSPGAAIPEFDQRPDDGTKVPSAVAGQDTGDVFPYQPRGPESSSQAAILEGQVAAVVIHSASKAGDAEGLTGSSADENIDTCCVIWDPCHVAEVRHVWEAMRKHRGWELLDLGEPLRLPAERLPSDRRGLDAATHAAVPHRLALMRVTAACTA